MGESPTLLKYTLGIYLTYLFIFSAINLPRYLVVSSVCGSSRNNMARIINNDHSYRIVIFTVIAFSCKIFCYMVSVFKVRIIRSTTFCGIRRDVLKLHLLITYKGELKYLILSKNWVDSCSASIPPIVW